jgi:hypothetical protein
MTSMANSWHDRREWGVIIRDRGHYCQQINVVCLFIVYQCWSLVLSRYIAKPCDDELKPYDNIVIAAVAVCKGIKGGTVKY